MVPPPVEPDLEALEGLAWYIQRRPVFTGGNEVRLLRGGQELFPTLRDRIDAAQHSVWMAFYIVSPLGQGGWVLQALMRAARRGVKVHLLVDYSRDGEGGAVLSRHANLWIVTFEDGRWGVKQRSY